MKGIGGPEPYAADQILNGRTLDKGMTRDRGAPKAPTALVP